MTKFLINFLFVACFIVLLSLLYYPHALFLGFMYLLYLVGIHDEQWITVRKVVRKEELRRVNSLFDKFG